MCSDSRRIEVERDKHTFKFIEKFRKMIVFGKYDFYPELIGLNPQGGSKNLIGRIILSVTFISFILMTSTFLLQNLHQNLNQVLMPVTILIGFGAIIAVYFHILVNRKLFYGLLEEIESVVLESICVVHVHMSVH